MRKQIAIVGIILLLITVGLSGCISDNSIESQKDDWGEAHQEFCENVFE
jgi:hypothetical protein